MAKDRFRLFTAERTGLLTVAALILFIAATAMCSRTTCSTAGAPATPDSALVRQIDSAIHAPADTIKKKKPRKQKKADKPKTRPYSRNHLQEIVDTI
ncbi:MAG: hypothetical protein NC102_00330 [Clostridium sp.]|nr:hypothetical protein [Clostridium sp.]